jgi:4-diphosphocytidyl-2-C-methyl-D-erythritol kinase
MNRVVLSSPAKLNLFLKVINKRPDGYHNLVTLFERIDLADRISFSANRDGRIRIACNNPQVPRGPKNLVYRAAMMLKEDFALANGVDVKITKRIPVAAGLAGGSSNAATALLGLNKIWRLGLSRDQLLEYASRLGSDVSLFLHDCSWALGTCRGEKIKKVPLKTKLWHVLLVPRLKMYSRNVFESLNLRPEKSGELEERKPGGSARGPLGNDPATNLLTKTLDDVNILIRYLRNNNISMVGQWLSNDLEKPIVRLSPSLFKIKNRLDSLVPNRVAFSGSGPSLFGIVDSKRQAEKLSDDLKKRYSQVFVVRTL